LKNKTLSYFSSLFLFFVLIKSFTTYSQKKDTRTLPNKVISKDSILRVKKDSTLTISLQKKDTLILSKNIEKIDSLFALKKYTLSKKRVPINTLTTIKKRITKKKKTDTVPYIRSRNFLTKFTKPVINLKQGEIISNVLKVINLSNKDIRFATDILYPAGWVRIDDPDKIYTAKAKDTTIVPIIISPTKLINGNTEIIINVFLIGSNQEQLANNYFSLKTKKKISWKLNLDNSQDIYFKNGESTKRLDFKVRNTGNYKQDLFINYTIPKKDLFLSDTLNNPIHQPNKTFTLAASEKKEFNFIITAKNLNKRNHKKISLNTYSPNKNDTRKTHSLIINSSEPKSAGSSLQKRTKINFIKLPNKIEANPYGYPYIPLTVELSAQNVLDDRTFMSLNLRGFKQLNQRSSLIYSTQLNYSNSFFTNNVFKNAPWYVGYFDEKKTLEVGQISGNLIGISNAGRGIKGRYYFNEQHAAGAFYVNSSGFFNSNSNITIGGWYKYTYSNNFDITARFGKNNNKISKRSISLFSIHPNVNFLKKHYVSFTAAFTKKELDIEPIDFKSKGYLIGTSYTSKFLRKKLRVNFSFRYNNKDFSFSNFDRLVMNQRLNYEINTNWSAYLSTNYQNLKSFRAAVTTPIFNQELLFNSLVFSNHNKTGSYQPGLYYEFRNMPNNVFHARGFTFRYSNYNFFKNFVTSLYTKIGYTKPVDTSVPTKDYFTLEISSLARYKTWSLTTRYDLGAFSSITSQNNVNQLLTPQSLRVSIQNQYLFKNRHFAIETNAIYSYNNIFQNHTLGLFPVAYYYSNTGWRFGFSANYLFTSSDFSSVFDATDLLTNPNLKNIGPQTTANFNLNFNLRKEFGIPIPFVNKIAATKTFVSFLDINGNGIKESNESTIQNVVIKMNKNEVLTNLDGEAIIKNLPLNKYKLEVFSLEKLNGWFPNTADSISIEKDGIAYIPFVRGIKVYGDVILDRQKIAVTDKKPFDLSRIRISATKGEKTYNTLTNKNGTFEFYLPFGDYTITMDEGILSGRFQITRNNIPLQLKNSQDGVYTSFYIVEKRRKVIFKDFSKKNK